MRLKIAEVDMRFLHNRRGQHNRSRGTLDTTHLVRFDKLVLLKLKCRMKNKVKKLLKAEIGISKLLLPL